MGGGVNAGEFELKVRTHSLAGKAFRKLIWKQTQKAIYVSSWKRVVKCQSSTKSDQNAETK